MIKWLTKITMFWQLLSILEALRLVPLLVISAKFSNYIWLNIILSFLLVTLVILISAFVTVIFDGAKKKN
ncbi:MAG TPA: hypothetical protein IAC02_03090 [Candidatus Coprovivens excrementavium]|nr:hypothetical protein [Candidatus Coprovivens excrementavium]